MNRVTQFVIGIIALALAAGAAFLGRDRYLEEVSTFQLPVPISEIPAYTPLRADLFEMRELPRAMDSLPYYQASADLEGKMSTVSLPAGLPVARVNAEPISQFRLAEETLEVLSIPVEPVSAVGGQVRIGERVNLYQVLPGVENPAGPTLFSRGQPAVIVELIARSVLVVDVLTSRGAPAGVPRGSEGGSLLGGSVEAEPVQILTLAVDPGAVEAILAAVGASQKQGGLLWTTLALP